MTPELTWRRLLRLAALGLAADISDGRPAAAPRPSRPVPAAEPGLSRPIFVIGSPRSGTTFLGGGIGGSPGISYHFEPLLTKAAARCVYDGSWSAGRSEATFRAYYRALLLASGKPRQRFAEKTPENCFIVPFLAGAFPRAQFVHIIRDGRDAAVSHARQPWLAAASAGGGRRGRTGQPFGPYPRWWVEPARRAEFAQVSDHLRAAWCWRRFTGAALSGLAGLPEDRRIEVRYEALTADPGATADRLAAFLGFTTGQARALRGRLSQARVTSVGQWRSVLQGRLLTEVQAEIGPLLGQLHYR